MLTVERMVVFEYKHRDLGRWLVLRLDKDRYVGESTGARCCWRNRRAGRRNLSAAHGMSRIHRITRQDRDVVMLGWIQNHLAGIQRRLCGARPASAITNIAHCGHAENGLATLAGSRPHAALRHDRHVAGVEVRPKDGRGPLGSGSRAGRRQGVGLAIGVDKESAVFLNNPAVVLRTECSLGYAVDQRHMKVARRWEDEHGCRRAPVGSLRVLGSKSQTVRA